MIRIDKNRHLIILDRLFSSDGYTTSRELAAVTAASVRTVKSDISYLKGLLREERAAELLSVESKGYRLEPIDEDCFIETRDTIQRMRMLYQDHSMENMNRRLFILQKLLASDSIRIDDLSDELFLSRTALAPDLKWVTEFLQSYQIELTSTPGIGLFVKGRESDLRAAMVEVASSQYHEFKPAYEVPEFNEMFYTDRQEYETLRHAFLKILRESPVSLTDLNSKKCATYLCLIRGRASAHPLEKFDLTDRISESVEYRLTEKIFRDLSIDGDLPEEAENEIVGFARELICSRDFDLRNEQENKSCDPEIFDRNERLLSDVIRKIKEITGPSLFESDPFKKAYIDFLSVQLSITIRHLYGTASRARLPGYNEYSLSNSSFLPMEYGRIYGSVLNEVLDCPVDRAEIKPVVQLFRYTLAGCRSPYKKRRLAVISLDSRAAGEQIRASINRNYGAMVDSVEVFNQYEMRRVSFSDYDAALTSTPTFDVYNNYPLKFAYYAEPLTTENRKDLFSEVFIEGFDSEVLELLKKITSVHRSTSMSDYDTFLRAMVYRYGSNEAQFKTLEERLFADDGIIPFYSSMTGNSVVFFDPAVTKSEFVHIYVPQKDVVRSLGRRVRAIIGISLRLDREAGTLRMLDTLLYYLLKDLRNLELLEQNPSRAWDLISREACSCLFDSMHELHG